MPNWNCSAPRDVMRSRHMLEFSKKLDAMNLSYNKRLKLWHRELRRTGW